MSKRHNSTESQTNVLRSSKVDLRTLSWQLLGLGYLIAHSDENAAPSSSELYGIGSLIQERAQLLEQLADELEALSAKRQP